MPATYHHADGTASLVVPIAHARGVRDNAIAAALRRAVRFAWGRRCRAQRAAASHARLGNDIMATAYRRRVDAANAEIWTLLEVWSAARRQVRG